ncbi:hypothetical protein EMCRGX_G024308 [Ephydatia muelleri]
MECAAEECAGNFYAVERGHLKRNCPSRKSFVDSAAVQKSVSKQSRPKQAVKDTIDQMTTLNRPGPKCQGQSGCTPVAV